MLSQGTSATALEKTVIDTFNTKLVAKAKAFATANSGATTYTYDSNAKVTQILNSPTTYGLVDATSYGDVVKDAWCKSPSYRRLCTPLFCLVFRCCFLLVLFGSVHLSAEHLN